MSLSTPIEIVVLKFSSKILACFIRLYAPNNGTDGSEDSQRISEWRTAKPHPRTMTTTWSAIVTLFVTADNTRTDMKQIRNTQLQDVTFYGSCEIYVFSQ